MEVIEQRPNGKWRLRYRDNPGDPIRSIPFATRREAMKWLEDNPVVEVPIDELPVDELHEG